MAEVTTKPSPAAEVHAADRLGISTARLTSVVDRSTKLSDEVLKSLEANERAAIEAAGKFLITIEEALPQEVLSTSDVAKTITESGLEMVDRMVQTEYEFLRSLIDSAAKSVRSRHGGKL